jgi:hypothetical protein
MAAGITIVTGNVLPRESISTLDFGGVDIGCTTEKAVNIKVTPEYAEQRSGQSKFSIRKTLTKIAASVQLELLDVRLSNLQKAFNQAASNLSGCCLSVDDNVGSANTLKVVGVGPNGQSRTFYFFSAIITSEVNYNMGPSEDTILPVTFDCMHDPTADKVFYVLDAAA